MIFAVIATSNILRESRGNYRDDGAYTSQGGRENNVSIKRRAVLSAESKNPSIETSRCDLTARGRPHRSTPFTTHRRLSQFHCSGADLSIRCRLTSHQYQLQ